jgi:hypothetical protein
MTFPSSPDSRQFTKVSSTLSQPHSSPDLENERAASGTPRNGPEVALAASPFAKSWAHFIAGGYVNVYVHPQ